MLSELALSVLVLSAYWSQKKYEHRLRIGSMQIISDLLVLIDTEDCKNWHATTACNEMFDLGFAISRFCRSIE